jgi:hypothetical protein
MDRRFSNATSSLASAALKLCTELANYWRTVLSDQGYRPELHYMRGPGICAALARSGARPTCVCAKRDKRVEFTLMPEWMATRILALLLGLSGGFAAHYTLLVLGVIH